MCNNLTGFLFFHSIERKTNGFSSVKSMSLMLFSLFVFGSAISFAQNNTISGTVTAEDMGSPIPGVSVFVKGTSIGTSTDFDGNYSLNISEPNVVLIFSYIGYATQEIKVDGKSRLNVVLIPSTESLDEVVVIGYGTSKKSDLTGSVVSIGGSDLKEQGISNVAGTLTGRLAGVQVISTDGAPDAEISIRVRGAGSLSQDSSPLIIVDGFPVSSLNDISPTDIESLTVLKDASSTAIYGSRGAGGVIIVTTKSGKEGKISVNFNTFYGVKQIANTIDVLSPEDYVKWQYEYALLDDQPQTYESLFGLYQDYDQYVGMKGNNWQKQIYGRTGEVNSRDLSLRGGSDIINYNFNYALYDEKAIQIGSDFKRSNLSLALKSKVSEKVDLSFTIRYSDAEINGGGANEQNEISSADSRLKHSVGYSPVPIPQLTTANTDEALNGYLTNPFVAVADNQRRQLRENINILGSFSWKILDDLKFKSDVGLNKRNNLDYRFYGRSTYYSNNRPPVEFQQLAGLIIKDRKRESFRNANTLNYNFQKLMGENHDLKLLLGEEMIISKDNRVTSEIHGFPADFDFERATRLTSLGTPFNVENFYSPDDKLLSFFGRINYGYKNRYLLTATYRIDGSSKFLGENQWGYFPSAAFAWKITEEDFLSGTDWLDLLKLRLSYGESGNNNIPSGQQASSYSPSTTSYLNGIENYLAPSTILANPDLKWETTVSQNLGLDFGLFEGRLSGSFEMYKNVTTDLLLLFDIAGTGYKSQYRNVGEIQNTGFEASLNINAIEKENFGLDISFNVGVNKNRINSLGSLQDYDDATNWASSQIGDDYLGRVGQPIGVMYGYQNDGRYEVSDFNYDAITGEYTLKDGVANSAAVIGEGNLRPGSMKLKDIDGDGIVDINDNTIIGDANPDHTGGMVLNARAYGFDLSAAFNWSVGNDVYNANKVEFTTANENGQYRNLSTVMADGNRWTNLDPTSGQLVTDPAQLEALNANTTMWSPYMQNFVFSDWAVEDGSFLRLNTLTLGYTLPDSVLSEFGISKLRLYATATNVFIITNYSGLDPEVSTRRKSPLTPGVDYSPYPKSRQIVFGLNLNF